MSIDRQLFLRTGGFDTRFTRGGAFGNEDHDLGARLLAAGAVVSFNVAAVSRQRYIVTPREYLEQWRNVGAADVLLARKLPSQANALGSRPDGRWARLAWRPFRWPLRALALALTRGGLKGSRTSRLFFLVRDLEYFRGNRAAGGPLRPRPVRVLCYHSVSDLAGRPVLAEYGIPRDEFRRQVQLLARRFRFVDAAEFGRFLAGGDLPRRPLLLTFDDCYADLVEQALEVLVEHEAPAIAFAVTSLVGETNEWDAAIGAPKLPLTDADGLRTLAANGVAVGSHSRTHAMLNRVERDALDEELVGSADDLEVLGLGRPTFLAYPHGEHDDVVRRAAAAAGYDAAFTVDAGLVRPDGDRFTIPRIEILRSHSGRRFLWTILAAGRFRRDSPRWAFGRRARSDTPSPPA
jgi:peptidoglycan/xylan/chitin deacetylase (PgdA/CDA1 family)